MMDKKNKAWIEKTLQDIPFVIWDRYLDIVYKGNRIINVFGWIDREDSYKDFVDLEFNLKTSQVFFISTSSKKYSEEISKILGSSHVDCNRVEDGFKINNSISLSRGLKIV